MKSDKQKIFTTWFNRKWSEWDMQQDFGKHTTQQELADWIGITRSAIAQYASGRKTPDESNLIKITKKFGNEIYKLLEIEIPESEFSEFPEPLASKLQEVSSKIEFLRKAGNFKKNSLEHIKITKEVFEKYGLLSLIDIIEI